MKSLPHFSRLFFSFFLLFSATYLPIVTENTYASQEKAHNNELFSPSTTSKAVNNHPDTCQRRQPRQSLSGWISSNMQGDHSLWIQLLLALFLGFLMSLTPCIYPMIPITLSILQAHGSKSIGRNFLLALSYTLGIATTFALLGLAAAFSGNVFGSLASHPVVVLCIVALLAYLGGAMLGLYELSFPRFMQSSRGPSRSGSFISSFAIGAASGTVTSPCLSPGLILLLSIVSNLGSLVTGFLLLFSFGFGIGIPLLIIGTIGGSLNILPRAGAWMVEVKRLFGILLFAMAAYYLKAVLPPQLLWVLITACSILIAFFYQRLYHTHQRKAIRYWHLFMILLMSCTSLYGTKMAVSNYTTDALVCSPGNLQWQEDYHCARHYAIEEKKLLFIDIGSPSCSLCHAIDAELLSHLQVECELEKHTISVKIDATSTGKSTDYVKKTFAFYGVPALFLVDPKTEQVMQQWGPELYDINVEAFIESLRRHYTTSK